MKKCLILVLILFSVDASAQTDTSSKKSIFNATLKLGSFYGQSSPTQKIQGFAYNPFVTLGRKVKLNIGFLIVNLDTNGQKNDTLETRFDNFEIGLSFEEYIKNTNLYVGGGLNLLGASDGNLFIGSRVLGNFGYMLSDVIDLSIQGSRTFNRNPGISGDLLMFGVGFRF